MRAQNKNRASAGTNTVCNLLLATYIRAVKYRVKSLLFYFLLPLQTLVVTAAILGPAPLSCVYIVHISIWCMCCPENREAGGLFPRSVRFLASRPFFSFFFSVFLLIAKRPTAIFISSALRYNVFLDFFFPGLYALFFFCVRSVFFCCAAFSCF